MTIHPRHVGCDISKEFLDVFDPADGAVRRIVNDALSASRWAATIAGAPAIVVLEATGPYDLVLRDALTAAGVAFVRVNPRRARCFAEAAGLLAKTDAVDARMLAAFGAALALPPDAPADPARRLRRLGRLVPWVPPEDEGDQRRSAQDRRRVGLLLRQQPPAGGVGGAAVLGHRRACLASSRTTSGWVVPVAGSRPTGS